MSLKINLALLATVLLIGLSCSKDHQQTDYCSFVDPLIGSDDHGHVFVGANVPHGMVQLGPTNLSKGWDWCSGYHYSDSTIIGFAHTHLSGTGIGDLGDILFMPYTGQAPMYKGSFDNLSDGYVSTFDRANEKAEPGYYKVLLNKYGITAELTAGARTGYHRYSYPDLSNRGLIIDLAEGIDWDKVTESMLSITSDGICGYRYSTGWAKDQKIYFYAILPKGEKRISLYEDTQKVDTSEHTGLNVKARIEFSENMPAEVEVKVGISYVSIDNARENLLGENIGRGFDDMRQDAHALWNSELSSIKMESGDPTVMRTFYTALYHTKFAPYLFSDINGQYRGADGAVHYSDRPAYTVFSLWDTYRAANPLYTIVETDRVDDYMNSLLNIYLQQGSLPVWHLVGNETNTMVGYHSAALLADAALKGYDGFDHELALKASLEYARSDRRGLEYVNSIGYIPADKEEWSVAKALEYAIDDWSIAQLARSLDQNDIYEQFMSRSKYYEYYFDKQINFMRGRMSDGMFRPGFNPSFSLHMEDDFVEGNSWQYTFLVPHDVPGLMGLMGGTEPFESKLDSLFTVSSELNEGASIDISGMIGQYAHGNEPSHHTIYMYNYTGSQYKTAERVRQVLREQYHDAPAGLSGNEDCGQMSAWYILSSLGFYQVKPAGGIYLIGSPAVEKAEITLPGGKVFKIVAENQSPGHVYIQQVKLNGNNYPYTYIRHEDIMKGGTLEFTMGPLPQHDYGKEQMHRPE